MTMKPKAQPDEGQAVAPSEMEEQVVAPACGEPHHLAVLAHLACAKNAGHGEAEDADQKERRHEVRYEGTLYAWE